MKFHLCVTPELKSILQDCSETSATWVDVLWVDYSGPWRRGGKGKEMKIKSYLSALFICWYNFHGNILTVLAKSEFWIICKSLLFLLWNLFYKVENIKCMRMYFVKNNILGLSMASKTLRNLVAIVSFTLFHSYYSLTWFQWAVPWPFYLNFTQLPSPILFPRSWCPLPSSMNSTVCILTYYIIYFRILFVYCLSH